MRRDAPPQKLSQIYMDKNTRRRPFSWLPPGIWSSRRKLSVVLPHIKTLFQHHILAKGDRIYIYKYISVLWVSYTTQRVLAALLCVSSLLWSRIITTFQSDVKSAAAGLFFQHRRRQLMKNAFLLLLFPIYKSPQKKKRSYTNGNHLL